MDARPDRYRLVGPVDDELTWLDSGPAIHRTRLAMLVERAFGLPLYAAWRARRP
jgi:hypothetical protein